MSISIAPDDGGVSVSPTALWPTFRHDRCNSGRSSIAAYYHGDQPWAFQTGKGIFSTPVIDETGTIYVGSADHIFYALTPEGRVKWQFETGEIIDSAGALLHGLAGDGGTSVVFPSGDGYLRCLRAGDGTLQWAFDARVAPRSSFNNWFEANVAVGPGGTLYAGNTNFNYYAITSGGKLQWTYETGANAWSNAGFLRDGTLIWGSCDTFVRAVSPAGREKWRKRTWGFVSASAAIGADDTVYIGAFDSVLYALNGRTGRVKWKFRTGDHIYASAALGVDARGATRAIYIGSTDGIFYALDPDGRVLWTYDTGAPIRSSAAIGRVPEGEAGDIVYFGCGNGRLYALNAEDGTRRWSFDTTSDAPELRDRNDLNGSPALSRTGVVIGGEHGQVCYVPYDYCRHASDDPRCCIDPQEDLPRTMTRLVYVSPGGNLQLTPPETLLAATALTLRLVCREKGATRNVRMTRVGLGRTGDDVAVTFDPPLPFCAETAADGRAIHIRSQGFLRPGRPVTIDVRGNLYTGGINLGNLTLGGRKLGKFANTFTFQVAPSRTQTALWHPIDPTDAAVPAIEWTRLAAPFPTMLPSLNQIGFDYMDWIMGLVAYQPQEQDARANMILWAIGGKRDDAGRLVVDPDSDFTLPLSGEVQGDAFYLINRTFLLKITGIPIPFTTFELRGQMGADGRVQPGATAYAETKVLSIPTFGPLLVLAGLANNGWKKLVAKGTYVTRPYRGPANRRPEGLHVTDLAYVPPTRGQAGYITATFSRTAGIPCPIADHRPGILLIDSETTTAIPLDYHRHLSTSADGEGNLTSVSLSIPRRTRLPRAMEAVVILDVFPLYRASLQG